MCAKMTSNMKIHTLTLTHTHTDQFPSEKTKGKEDSKYRVVFYNMELPKWY